MDGYFYSCLLDTHATIFFSPTYTSTHFQDHLCILHKNQHMKQKVLINSKAEIQVRSKWVMKQNMNELFTIYFQKKVYPMSIFIWAKHFVCAIFECTTCLTLKPEGYNNSRPHTGYLPCHQRTGNQSY